MRLNPRSCAPGTRRGSSGESERTLHRPQKLVAICEKKVLDALLVAAHTLGGATDPHEGIWGDRILPEPVLAKRFGRRSGRLNRLRGELSCGFNKSLRPPSDVKAARRRGIGARERSARQIGRAQSEQSETDLFACDAEGLPACVRWSRSRRALSPAVRGGAPGWPSPAGRRTPRRCAVPENQGVASGSPLAGDTEHDLAELPARFQ